MKVGGKANFGWLVWCMLTLALKILTSLKQTAEFFNALGKIYKAFSSHEKYQAYRLSSIQEASGWSATLFSYCGGMNLLLNLIKVKLSLGKFPDQWKLVNVCPVYKSDDPTLPKNYRPISLLCIISKCLERCVFNNCYTLISPQFYHLQHGFLRQLEEGPLLLISSRSITKWFKP